MSTGVLWSPVLGLHTNHHPATSESNCSCWSESAGVKPLQHCELRASCRSLKIDWELSNRQATHSCCEQNLRDVFCWTWRSREPAYVLFWVLTLHWSACYYPWVSLHTCVSHNQATVCISVSRCFGGISLHGGLTAVCGVVVSQWVVYWMECPLFCSI